MNNLNISGNYSIQQMQDMFSAAKKNNENLNKGSIGNSFEEILANAKKTSGAVKFSKHATERLSERNIDMSDEQMDRLESGVKKAGAKGIKESLVMIDEMAFIVNIKNNTVVTAVTGDDEMVFSNIDGAVIA